MHTELIQPCQVFFAQHSEPCWLACSGGMDSMVLLDVLIKHHRQHLLGVVHVNHHLHPDSNQWQQLGEQYCQQHQVPFKALAIDLRLGENLEARARQERYQAIADYLGSGATVCLAHHQSDQVETGMLRFLSGAGLQGMAAMRAISEHSGLKIIRPLLSVPQAVIESYAAEHNIPYCQDPANDELRFRRNFLRHQVLPLLATQWPQCTQNMARSIQHLQEAQQLLNTTLEPLLKNMLNEHQGLNIKALLAQPQWAQLIVRQWLVSQGCHWPQSKHLDQIFKMIHARADAQPQLLLEHRLIYRYHGALYVQAISSHPDDLWQQLTITQAQGQGISPQIFHQLTLHNRQGGEKIALNGCHQKLKKLLQAWHIPPHQRDTLPLAYYHGELVCVPGYAIADHVRCAPSDIGYVLAKNDL